MNCSGVKQHSDLALLCKTHALLVRKHSSFIYWVCMYMCVMYLLLHKKYPQIYWLKTYIYYLTASMRQETKRWLIWVLYFSVSYTAIINMLTRARSHLTAQWGRFCFQVHIVIGIIQFLEGLLVWGSQFLINCWPKATLSSLPPGLLQDVLLARRKWQSYVTK